MFLNMDMAVVCLGGGGEVQTQLREANIPVITSDTCDTMWGDSFNSQVHICVWDAVTMDKGACNVSDNTLI